MLATPIDCLVMTRPGAIVTVSVNSVPIFQNSMNSRPIAEPSEHLPENEPEPYVTAY